MGIGRNVPGRERVGRAVVGVVLLIVAASLPLPAAWMWIVIAGGVGALATSAIGFCPACAMIGRRP